MSSRTSSIRGAVSRAAGLTLAAGLAGLVAAGPASAQIVLKFGTQTQNDVQHEYMKVFKAKLEAATSNKVRVDLFPASQLGPPAQQINGLRLGNVQAFAGPFEFYVGVDPSFQTTSMAGLFRDNEHMRAVANKPEFRKVLQEVGDKKGVTVGAFIVYDMQYFSFKTPAASFNDVKGKRVRVLASEAEQAAVQALGMSSIPMPIPEVLPALQQGTIDGVSSGLTIFTTLRYYDAAPHMLDTRLWGILTGVLFSKSWLEEQPADIRKTILDVAQSIEAENHAWNQKNLKDAREVWAKNNGIMKSLSPAEQADAQKRVAEATVKVLAKYPAVKATYDAIKAIADATK